MLRHRLPLGALLIAVLLGLIWLDERVDRMPAPGSIPGVFESQTCPPGSVFFVVMLALSILAARELAAILAVNGIASSKRMTTLAAVAGMLVSCLVPVEFDGITSHAIVCSVAVGVLIASLLFFSRHRSCEGVVAAAGGTLLAFVYLGLLFGFFMAIRREHSAYVVLWILAVTKACDIGAYFTGITLGRHKLIPWLSPGKTWEGLIGGVLTSAAVGMIGVLLLERGGIAAPGEGAGALAGVIFGLTGQVGDLVESLFKRDAGFKDSGRTLPGFGGILDVVDSPLLVAPVAYWLVRQSQFG